MRLHSIMPWPPIPLPSPRKPEKTKRPKAAEQKRDLFGVAELRVQPPRRKREDDDLPGENIDIIV